MTLATNGRKLSESHPNLYWVFMVLALMTVAHGFNFIFKTPAFNPFDIPKGVTGIIFLVVGWADVLLLNVFPSAWRTRAAMVTGVALHFFWALILTLAALIDTPTSYQLPIYVLGLVLVFCVLMREPFINPVTDKNGGRK